MTIEYDYIIEDDILKVTTQGQDDNLEEVMNYFDELIEIAKTHNCFKVLCDERNLAYTIPVFDTFQLAEYASRQIKGYHKIAIICNNKYIKDRKFYETVSSNRGISILVSIDYNASLEWLLT